MPDAGVSHARGRALHEAAFAGDDAPLGGALHDRGDADVAPRAQPGTPVGSCPDGRAEVSRSARIEAHKPSGHHNRGAGGHRRGPARWPPDQRHVAVLTDRASHHTRVETIMARAIQTMPPCLLTRLSSACTGPRSRGCSTRCSWTAWP